MVAALALLGARLSEHTRVGRVPTSYLIPDTSGCGILDDGMELMAVKNGKVVNLSGTSGLAEDDRPTTTSLTLFNRYVISTKKLQDTVYVFFAGGYNLDGYILLDSELNVRAVSTWNYH